eukprot:PhF_6_TR17322/c1_g1_i2/m.26539
MSISKRSNDLVTFLHLANPLCSIIPLTVAATTQWMGVGDDNDDDEYEQTQFKLLVPLTTEDQFKFLSFKEKICRFEPMEETVRCLMRNYKESGAYAKYVLHMAAYH